MSRKTFTQATIPRNRGMYPVVHYMPSFINDLKPIPNNKAVCNEPNAGGRLDKFTADPLALDVIGEQTRKLQPGYCLKNNGKGGAVLLSETLTLTKWVVAFRVNNYIPTSLDFIIGGNSSNNIVSSKLNKLAYRALDGTYYLFDGTDNTLDTDSSELKSGIFISNGSTISLYVNGVYRGYVTSNTLTLYVNKLIQGYTSNAFNTKGYHYDYRLWDLTDRTTQEINDYFDEHACKFHIDNMPKNDGWTKHIWNMQDKDTTFVADSGDALPRIHGTLFYDDVNTPSLIPRDVTTYPEWMRNPANKYGYAKAAYFEKASKITYPSYYLYKGDSISFDIIFNTVGVINNNIFRNDSDSSRLLQNLTNRFQIKVINMNDGLSYWGFVYTSFNIKPNTPYNIKFKIITNGIEITIGGETISYDFGYEVKFEVDKIGSISNDSFEGFIANVKKNEVIFDPLNGSTIGAPTNIDWNKILIPVSQSDLTKDIFGRDLINKGIAKLNAKVKSGIALKSIDGGVLTFDDLTGITIVSSKGTSTPTISGNDINLTEGILEYLELSDGSVFYFNGNLINSLDGSVITAINTTFEDTLETTQSTLASLNKTVYKLATGELVIDPQYPLPSGATKLSDKGYKGVGVIDYDPEIWDEYYSYEDNDIEDSSFNDATKWALGSNLVIASGSITHTGTATDTFTEATPIPAIVGKEYIFDWDSDDYTVTFGGVSVVNREVFTATTTDTMVISCTVDGASMGLITRREAIKHVDFPNRVGNLIVNGGGENTTDWIDSDSDGLADGWAVYGTADILTIYQDEGSNVQKIVSDGVNRSFLYSTIFLLKDFYYWIEITYKSISGSVIGNAFSINLPASSVFTTIKKLVYSNDRTIRFNDYTTSVHDLSIKKINVYKLEASNELGFLPFAIMDFTNDKYWKPTILALVDFNDIHSLKLTPEIILEHMQPEYYGHVYLYYKNGTEIYHAVYPNKKTQAENDSIVIRGGLPNYTL